MRIQQNPKTNQKFINLPKELCDALNIDKGMDVSFKVINNKSLLMILEEEE